MTSQQTLKSVYLFSNFTDGELSRIANIAKEKIVMAGQDIFTAGQKAVSFYVVKQGAVKIYSTSKAGDDMELIQFGVGVHFGEIPFLDGQVRSANATATEQTTLLEFNYAEFKAMLDADMSLANKVYKNFSQNLSSRLRTTTESLQKTKEIKLRIA
jgi:CRP-like cAMP-binding protein